MKSQIVTDSATIDAILREQSDERPIEWHRDWPILNGHRRWLLRSSREAPERFDVPLEEVPLRALPGHFILRLHMLGLSSEPESTELLLSGLQDCISNLKGALRLETYVVSNSESRRREFESMLLRLGFVEELKGCFPATYRDSLVVDLKRNEDDIFGELSRSARRNVRLVERRPVRLVRLEEEAYADRLQYLWSETLARKGAALQKRPWKDYLEFSRRHPDRAAVFGLASTEGPFEANSIFSMVFVTRSGECGRWEESATASNTSLRIGLAHAPKWRSILWAKQTGATWFDLTGTKRNVLSSDPMFGVSEFKRQFGGDEIQVRSDWSWTPRSRRFYIAQTISKLVSNVRHIKRRLDRSA